MLVRPIELSQKRWNMSLDVRRSHYLLLDVKFEPTGHRAGPGAGLLRGLT